MERFQTKKSLGQHFLNSAVVPRWLSDAGEVGKGDLIVEIGPGTGALTRELLARGAKVLALEADHRAIEVLESEFSLEIAAGQLSIVHADARKLDLESLGLQDHSFKVVANIPYYLTGQLFRSFLEGPVQPSQLVFLVQKEVAKRATESIGKGGKESLLSLSLQAFGRPIYVREVGKGHFTPMPKVDSAIIAVAEVSRKRFKSYTTKEFFEILHLGFGSKRKQLIGNLSKTYAREELLKIFQNLGFSPDVRAEDVSIDRWLDLVEALKGKR